MTTKFENLDDSTINQSQWEALRASPELRSLYREVHKSFFSDEAMSGAGLRDTSHVSLIFNKDDVLFEEGFTQEQINRANSIIEEIMRTNQQIKQLFPSKPNEVLILGNPPPFVEQEIKDVFGE